MRNRISNHYSTNLLFIMFYIFLIPISLIFTSFKNNDIAAETFSINKIQYTVNGTPISKFDMEQRISILKKQKVKGNVKKRALQDLVDRVIFDETAKELSVFIDEDSVEEELRARASRLGFSYAEFVQKIQKEINIDSVSWKENVRYEMIKRQISQLSLRVKKPTAKEVQSFYNANKKSIGSEFTYREIILAPKNSSIQEEAKISKQSQEIYQKLKADPKQFAKIARTTSNNVSPTKKLGRAICE